MTREIKFRGKHVDNGEWVYGAFVPDVLETPDNDLITWGFIRRYNRDIGKMESIEVSRESVGQYTGLCDKNGKEIYEGDIILWGDKTAREKGTEIHVFVEYKSGCFGIFNGENFHEFYHYMAGEWDDSEITDDMWGELPIEKYFRACFEVIGNIYDNPELLEVEHGK